MRVCKHCYSVAKAAEKDGRSLNRTQQQNQPHDEQRPGRLRSNSHAYDDPNTPQRDTLTSLASPPPNKHRVGVMTPAPISPTGMAKRVMPGAGNGITLALVAADDDEVEGLDDEEDLDVTLDAENLRSEHGHLLEQYDPQAQAFWESMSSTPKPSDSAAGDLEGQQAQDAPARAPNPPATAARVGEPATGGAADPLADDAAENEDPRIYALRKARERLQDVAEAHLRSVSFSISEFSLFSTLTCHESPFEI